MSQRCKCAVCQFAKACGRLQAKASVFNGTLISARYVILHMICSYAFRLARVGLGLGCNVEDA